MSCSDHCTVSTLGVSSTLQPIRSRRRCYGSIYTMDMDVRSGLSYGSCYACLDDNDCAAELLRRYESLGFQATVVSIDDPTSAAHAT